MTDEALDILENAIHNARSEAAEHTVNCRPVSDSAFYALLDAANQAKLAVSQKTIDSIRNPLVTDGIVDKVASAVYDRVKRVQTLTLDIAYPDEHEQFRDVARIAIETYRESDRTESLLIEGLRNIASGRYTNPTNAAKTYLEAYDNRPQSIKDPHTEKATPDE